MTRPECNHQRTALHAWMLHATTAQQAELAEKAGTSRAYLYVLGNGYRSANPPLAAAIERETARMHKETNGALPLIYRTDLNPHCQACSFARKCLGPIVERANFAFIETSDEGEGSVA